MANNGEIRAPTVEDFSPGAVKKAVAKKAVEKWSTVYSLALAGGSVFWMILFGPASISFLTMLVSLGLGGASFVFNFFIRGDTEARKYVQRLLDKRKQYREENIMSLREICNNIGFTEGEKQAQKLENAYRKLEEFLEKKAKNKSSASAQQYFKLAENTYNQGVAILQNAVEMRKFLNTINTDELKYELNKLKNALKNQTTENQDLAKIKIEGIEKQFELYDKRNQNIRELVAECEKLRISLETSYLELIDLIQDDGKLFFQEGNIKTSELERVIQSAKIVEEKLRGMQNPNSEEDKLFFEEGQRAIKQKQ